MDLKTTEFAHRCPACGKPQECLTGQGDPRPGAILLCFACHAWLVLLDGNVRLMTNAEWLALPPDARETLTNVRDEVKRAGAQRQRV